MKGVAQAALVAAAVGGALLFVARRNHPAPPLAGASSPAATAADTRASFAAPAPSSGAPAASPPAAPSTLPPRLDAQARAVMLRRIEEARARVAAAAQATAAAPADEQPLDKDYIRQQVRVLLPQLSECYNNALRRDPTLKGKMAVDFSIVGDPSVGGLVGDSKIKADESTIADAEMRECVQETMYGAQFVPPKEGGEVHVTYPFVFEPADDE